MFTAGCGFAPSTCLVCQQVGGSTEEEDKDATGPVVNLRIIGASSIAGFDAIASQVTAAGVHATVVARPDFPAEQCEALRALHKEGVKVAALVQPEPQDLTEAARTEIEYCLGASIRGVDFSDFEENEDTYEIVSALGFDHNLGVVTRSDHCLLGHEEDTLPCQSDAYDF